MKYEIKKEDVYSLAQALGIEAFEKGEEIFFKECPYCHGGEHRDQNTLSVNWKSGAYKCFRSSCGKTGHFAELARDMEFPLTGELTIYRQLPQPKEPSKPNEAVFAWLHGKRKIAKTVVEKYEIAQHKINKDVLVFPFYNEFGKLVFLKYRNTNPTTTKDGKKSPKEWCEKDCEPVLFGIKQATAYDKPLVITEGQIDSLSVATAGIENACSVPIGCNGFTWVQNCWNWIQRFSEVIVFGDNEHGKITLIDEIRNRFPKNLKIKCVRSIDYLGEKDANDILLNFGSDAIRTAITNAEEPEIPRLKELADVQSVDLNKIEKIKSGITEIDKATGGFLMGQVVLLTGKRGEGKSTLASQFASNALDQGERVFLYSGELADFWVQNWLDTQIAGSAFLEESKNEFGKDIFNVKKEAAAQIHDWYRGRCFIYDNGNIEVANPEKEMEVLLETMEEAIVQKGVRFLVIDNLMTAMDGTPSSDALYMKQSTFVGQLKRLAMKYNVVVLLLTHPRKAAQSSKKGNDLDNDDVSGSADITNKVDVVLSYGRASADREGVDNTVQVLKNRLYGILLKDNDAIPLRFSSKTKRVFGLWDKEPSRYSWLKEEDKPKEEEQAKQLSPLELELDFTDIPF